MTTTAELVNQLKGIGDRLTPIEGLLKALEKPAHAAGLSPTEFFHKMTNGGQTPTVVTHDGRIVPAVVDRRRKGIGMGPLLRGLAKHHKADLPGISLDERDRVFKEFQILEKTALAETSGVVGGYVVPPMFAEQLLTLSIEETVLAPRAAALPLTALTLQVPSLDLTTVQGAGNSSFLGGVQAQWVAEAQTRTEYEPQFRQTELKAHELSLYSVCSNTLLADAAIALDSLLTQLFSAAIGWYRDYAYFQGNGVGKPLGVLNAPATVAVTRQTPGRFQFADAANMWSKLYGMSWRAKSTFWAVHQSVFPQLVQMTDNANRAIFVPLNQGATEMPADVGQGGYCAGHIFGAPVFCTEKLPVLGTKGDVMLIDASKYLLGNRMDLQIEVSAHVKFLQNSMVWRVVWRGDGQPWLNNPITLADGAFTVSPFVALN